MATPRASLLRPLLIISFIVAGILFVLWGLPALFMTVFFHGAERGKPLELNEVAYFAHLKFPPEARLTEAARQSQGDGQRLLARVNLRKKDLAWFKANGFAKFSETPPKFASPEAALKSVPYFQEPKPGETALPIWWTPERVKDGEAVYLVLPDRGQASPASDNWLALLIDRRRGEVYLITAYR